MDQSILFIIIGASSLIGGLIVGKLVFARNTKKQVEEAEAHGYRVGVMHGRGIAGTPLTVISI